jgi:hypothetical protein
MGAALLQGPDTEAAEDGPRECTAAQPQDRGMDTEALLL